MGILSKDARWPEKNGNSEIIPFASFIWLFHQYLYKFSFLVRKDHSHFMHWRSFIGAFTEMTQKREGHTHTHREQLVSTLTVRESYWNTPDSGVEKLLLLFWAISLGLTSWFCCREKKREKKEVCISFTARQTVNKLLCTHAGCYAVVWPLLNGETGERVRQTWLKVCQANWPLHYVGG